MMQLLTKSPLPILLLIIFLLLSGCAATTQSTSPRIVEAQESAQLESALSTLVDQLRHNFKHSDFEVAPLALLPATVKGGGQYSRLHELVCQRLIDDLRQDHEIIILNRQQFFEYRDNRPLGIGQGGGRGAALENLVLFSIAVSPEPVLEKAKIRVTATDSLSNAIPGLHGSVTVDFSPRSLARRLQMEEARGNPYPFGVEEHPYDQVDRLTANLAAELIEAFRAGGLASGHTPQDHDVRVVLTAMPSPVTPSLARAILSGLQQEIIARHGFTCTMNQGDFSSFDQMIRFYESNPAFHITETRLTTATVFLFAEILDYPGQGMVGVSLRGGWRIDPKDAELGVVVQNIAGTYLSGFTAKAYLRL